MTTDIPTLSDAFDAIYLSWKYMDMCGKKWDYFNTLYAMRDNNYGRFLQIDEEMTHFAEILLPTREHDRMVTILKGSVFRTQGVDIQHAMEQAKQVVRVADSRWTSKKCNPSFVSLKIATDRFCDNLTNHRLPNRKDPLTLITDGYP